MASEENRERWRERNRIDIGGEQREMEGEKQDWHWRRTERDGGRGNRIGIGGEQREMEGEKEDWHWRRTERDGPTVDVLMTSVVESLSRKLVLHCEDEEDDEEGQEGTHL